MIEPDLMFTRGLAIHTQSHYFNDRNESTVTNQRMRREMSERKSIDAILDQISEETERGLRGKVGTRITDFAIKSVDVIDNAMAALYRVFSGIFTKVLVILPPRLSSAILTVAQELRRGYRSMILYGSSSNSSSTHSAARTSDQRLSLHESDDDKELVSASERGDVPGWVLVVLMTTGLVTAIWTIAAPRLSTILRNSLDSMNGIR